jgi:integrase
MATRKLTKSYLDDLQPGPTDAIHWDTEVKGFGVKVTPTGRKVFLFQYRPAAFGGNPRKFTIGRFGELTVEQARSKARELAVAKAAGSDPQQEKRARAAKFSSNLFGDLCDRFYADHLAQLRKSTYKDAKRVLEHEFRSAWASRSVHQITKSEVIAILGTITARGSEIMANRALAYVRKFFNWCKANAIIDISPCEGISAPRKERSRDRCLTDNELRAVLFAARNATFPFGPLVEALILTGQRRDEVALMRWAEVDFDQATWTIPPERAKNNQAHIVHLSSAMISVLEAARDLGVPKATIDGAGDKRQQAPSADRVVFSIGGEKAFQGWSKAKHRLDEAAIVELQKAAKERGDTNADAVKFPGWRLHDLRRTMVTGMASLGVPHHIADKILNHQSGAISGVAAVYQRHAFLVERKQALKSWGMYVEGLCSPRQESNVIPLPRPSGARVSP